MPVYFIRHGDMGPVKIGTAGNVVSRLRELQAGNPVELQVLRIVPGDGREEAWLHARFGHLRLRGEWFSFDPDMLEAQPGEPVAPPSDLDAAFLRAVDDFILARRIPATTLGMEALGDPNFVRDLRGGRSPSLRVVERVNRFIENARASEAA